jgi:hypothetical protein
VKDRRKEEEAELQNKRVRLESRKTKRKGGKSGKETEGGGTKAEI